MNNVKRQFQFMFNGIGILSTAFIAIWSLAWLLKHIHMYVSTETMLISATALLALVAAYFTGKTYVEYKEWKKKY